MKNIVLTGISGSGKTSIGKKLAERFRRNFIDLDTLICEKAGLTIDQIFSRFGEEGFRRIETEVIRGVSGTQKSVVACGGGAVLKPENMRLLSNNGVIVFMNRPVKSILNAVDLKDRPLLKTTPGKLHDIYRDRLPLYGKYADFEVKCDVDGDEVLNRLIRIAELENCEMKLAVIGDPIAHSLSPDIHMSVLGPFLKSFTYTKERVEKGRLPQWIEDVKNSGIDGFNVTMPHKEDILSYLDDIDEEAKIIGSVNTVVNKGGRFCGCSTDGDGFSSALAGIGEQFLGATVTIIGSGGAASVLAAKAAKEGAVKISLVARNQDKALRIAEVIRKNYTTAEFNRQEFLLSDAGNEQWSSDIIINTTPLGMGGIRDDFASFDFLDNVKEDAVVCDLIYNPIKTRLLIEAEKRGMKTMGGINMLIRQAVKADCHFTGVEISPIKAFDRAIENLKGKVEGI